MRRHSCILGRRRGAGGFARFELAVVVILVAILASVLLNRLLYYQELAEKAAMERTLDILRSSLRLQTASLIARGRSTDLHLLANQNPMDWLAEKPRNYVGEVDGLDEEGVVKGSWVFDKKNRNLVYLVHNAKHFRGGNIQSKQVIFRVNLIFGKLNSTQEKEATPEDVILEQANAYSWFR